MKVKSLLTMTFAALAMMACNDDIEKTGGPDNGLGELTGEQTYAVFNIKVSDGSDTRAATSGSGGTEDGVANENRVDSASVYVFQYVTEETGISEVIANIQAADIGNANTDDTTKILPNEPVMLTSGKKHLIVVANMTGTVKAQLDAAFGAAKKASGYEDFRAVVSHIANTTDPTTNFVTIRNTITMSGESDPTLVAGVTATDAKDPNSSNNVKVYVDRAVARLDVKLGTLANNTYLQTLPVVNPKTTKKVGDVDSFKYEVRNMNTDAYIMKRMKGFDFVESPFSGLITEGSWAVLSSTMRYPQVFPGTIRPFPKAIRTADGTAKYGTEVSFITETTNEFARTSNTAYVGLQAYYMPDNTDATAPHYVSGYTVGSTTGSKVTLTPATGFVGNKHSWFNFEHDLAFAEQDNENLLADNVKTLAGYHTSTRGAALDDIKKTDIRIIKGGVFDAAGSDITIGGYNAALPITDVVNTKAITKYVNDLPDTNAEKKATLFVFVRETKNTAQGDSLQRQYVTAIYVSQLGGDSEYVYNDGVNFGTLNCGMYKTVKDEGLKCFYRSNIFDELMGVTHQMRYSVVRNHSYHMAISKVSKIGFPTDGDLAVDPETPLNNNTFVQATITISKWTGKNMDDVEIGQ